MIIAIFFSLLAYSSSSFAEKRAAGSKSEKKVFIRKDIRDEFAEHIKKEWPEYKDIDNKALVFRVLNKFPIYEDKVRRPVERPIEEFYKKMLAKIIRRPKRKYTKEFKKISIVLPKEILYNHGTSKIKITLKNSSAINFNKLEIALRVLNCDFLERVENKLTTDEFAALIKKKYQEYKDIDNKYLAEQILNKFPEYVDNVSRCEKDIFSKTIRVFNAGEKKTVILPIFIPWKTTKGNYQLKVTAKENKYHLACSVETNLKVNNLMHKIVYSIFGIVSLIILIIILIRRIKKGFEPDEEERLFNLTISLSIIIIFCSVSATILLNNMEYICICFLTVPLWILSLVCLQVIYVVRSKKSLKPTIILSAIGLIVILIINEPNAEDNTYLFFPLIPWGNYFILWGIYFILKLGKSVHAIIISNNCLKCGTANRSESQYCKTCGYSLSLQKSKNRLVLLILCFIVVVGYFFISQLRVMNKSQLEAINKMREENSKKSEFTGFETTTFGKTTLNWGD